MKIVHITKGYPPSVGGIEQYTYDIANALNNDNDVFILDTNSNLFSIEKVNKIKVIRTKKFFDFLHAPINLPFFHILNQIRPDIIHIHIPNPLNEFYLLIYLLLKGKKTVIATYHADIPDYTFLHKLLSFLRLFYMIPLMKFFDTIIATSKNYTEVSTLLKKFKEKTKVIPIGSDTNLKTVSTNKLKMKYKIKNEKIVLFVGRFSTYKGLEYLVYSIPKVIKSYQNVKFILSGDGERLGELKQLAEKLHIEDKIIFTGKVDYKIRNTFYKICNMFVLPSINLGEAFGISLLEAMNFGKPLITTNVKGSGMNSINKQFITGLVVEPRNSTQLASSIVKLLKDDKLCIKLGNNSKKRFLSYFTKDKMITTTLKLYKSMVKQSK